MLKLWLMVLLASVAVPAMAARRVSVDQLEQLLSESSGKRDAKLAQRLSGLELTERLSRARLLRAEANLPDREARKILVVLADMSAFLLPPPSEMPATAVPDLSTQGKLIALTIRGAEKTIAGLPNFFATRDTIRFEDTPLSYRADMSVIAGQPLHPVGRLSETVLYRDGREQVDPAPAHAQPGPNAPAAVGQVDPAGEGLSTSGVFGAIEGRVLVDASHSSLVWSHWEQGPAGPIAVFRYAVPRDKSHYQVQFCCVFDAGGAHAFQQFSGYHGVIAVDPSDGKLLRLTLEADLKPSDSILRSDILVEYDEVEIGGRRYVCPVKSVSISLAPAVPTGGVHMQRDRGSIISASNQTAPGRLQTLLNDVTFTQYHVFRADARLLPSISAADKPSLAEPAAADTSSNSASPGSDIAAAEDPAKPVDANSGTPAVTPARPSGSPPSSNAAVPAIPEVTVLPAGDLPSPTALAQRPPGTTVTLHVTTRLVDLGVLVLDPQSHPVTGLQQSDFEVDDAGRRQELRYFTSAHGTASETMMKSAEPPVFSNRPRASIGNRLGAAEDHVTILLLDAANLAWTDLDRARFQVLQFLQPLPLGDRIGIYIMTAYGFEVLQEETSDHAALASRLRAWMPTAQDQARAQEMEARNRQHFDQVRNQTDLQYVNGNIPNQPETVTPVDPQLREDGSHAARDAGALPILSAVARHLAAVAGHKSLVWMTSDNVLANWSDKAASSDKRNQGIGNLVLQAQEALNEAHVSVYPLDASQLETMAIDPALENQSIQLQPGTSGPAAPHAGTEKIGRLTDAMRQDTHPLQAPIRSMAAATGGQAFGRSSVIAAALNQVVAQGRATYLLSFAPDQPADDRYHPLSVKLTSRPGLTLRYRAGYLYSKEPATLRDRFRQAALQPADTTDIAVTATAVTTPAGPGARGAMLRLTIAAGDLELQQQDDRWSGKLDVFLVRRDDTSLQPHITGQTLNLALKQVTLAKSLQDGIPFDQPLDGTQQSGSVRVIVVDENSGRMGSVTLPLPLAAAQATSP